MCGRGGGGCTCARGFMTLLYDIGRKRRCAQVCWASLAWGVLGWDGRHEFKARRSSRPHVVGSVIDVGSHWQILIGGTPVGLDAKATYYVWHFLCPFTTSGLQFHLCFVSLHHYSSSLSCQTHHPSPSAPHHLGLRCFPWRPDLFLW